LVDFALLDPDPDPADQKKCGCVRIRIRNTGFFHKFLKISFSGKNLSRNF